MVEGHSRRTSKGSNAIALWSRALFLSGIEWIRDSDFSTFSNVVGHILNQYIANIDALADFKVRSEVCGHKNVLIVRDPVAHHHLIPRGRRDQCIRRDHDLRPVPNEIKTHCGLHPGHKITLWIGQLNFRPHGAGPDVEGIGEPRHCTLKTSLAQFPHMNRAILADVNDSESDRGTST